jgi:surfeit locus 1 family protein
VSLDQRNVAAVPGSAAGAAPRRRVPIRIGLTMLTAVAVALFVVAGNWQHDRMRGKEALRERYDAAARAAPIDLRDARRDDWTALRYLTVVASGRFEAPRQIFIDNRVHMGQVGYEVVAPLLLDDGRRVLVDRGWVAQGPTRATLPDVPPPAGRLDVRGRIEIPAGGYFELSSQPNQGALWQHLDPERYAHATGIDVLPIVIEETDANDGLVRDRPPPDFGIERHQIYMVQWYSFAALAIALWALLTFRAWRRGSGSADG